jgi:hypothetical protein
VRAWTLVSDRDYAWLSQWWWYLDADGRYVRRSEHFHLDGGWHVRTIRMHRLILGLEPGDPRQGEHENRNKLDNRRENLRIATRAELDNLQNQGTRADSGSGFRGVGLNKNTGRWRARARVDRVTHYLGYFDTAEEADAVVKAFRAEHMPFSEDARLVT